MDPKQACSNSVKQQLPRNWLPLAIVGLCGIAVGLGIGLAVASIGGKSLAEATVERDRSVESARAAIVAKEEAEHGLDELRRQAEQSQRLTKQVNTEHEEQLEKAQKASSEMFVSVVKSQALICMLRDIDGMVDLIRGKKFRSLYRSDWFAPDESLKLMGGQWFVKELVKCGVVDEEVLQGKNKPAFEMAGTSWRVVKQWSTSGTKDTETFQIASRVWRINWISRSPVGVSIAVYRDGEKYAVASASGGGNDSSLVREGPGYFYLRIAGGAATVSVQEPVSDVSGRTTATNRLSSSVCSNP